MWTEAYDADGKLIFQGESLAGLAPHLRDRISFAKNYLVGPATSGQRFRSFRLLAAVAARNLGRWLHPGLPKHHKDRISGEGRLEDFGQAVEHNESKAKQSKAGHGENYEDWVHSVASTLAPWGRTAAMLHHRPENITAPKYATRSFDARQAAH